MRSERPDVEPVWDQDRSPWDEPKPAWDERFASAG